MRARVNARASYRSPLLTRDPYRVDIPAVIESGRDPPDSWAERQSATPGYGLALRHAGKGKKGQVLH
jgi:hypothetical protein